MLYAGSRKLCGDVFSDFGWTRCRGDFEIDSQKQTIQLSALRAPTGIGPLRSCAPSCSLRAWQSCGAWSAYIESLEKSVSHNSLTLRKNTRKKGVVALEILGYVGPRTNRTGEGGVPGVKPSFLLNTSSPSSRTVVPPRCKYVVFCTLLLPVDAHL